MIGITRGTWEAENGVAYITPEGNPTALIVYEANVIGYSEQYDLAGRHDLAGQNSLTEQHSLAEQHGSVARPDAVEQHDCSKRPDLTAELEANAWAIAKLPEMLHLLEELVAAKNTVDVDTVLRAKQLLEELDA